MRNNLILQRTLQGTLQRTHECRRRQRSHLKEVFIASPRFAISNNTINNLKTLIVVLSLTMVSRKLIQNDIHMLSEREREVW